MKLEKLRAEEKNKGQESAICETGMFLITDFQEIDLLKQYASKINISLYLLNVNCMKLLLHGFPLYLEYTSCLIRMWIHHVLFHKLLFKVVGAALF